MRCALRLKVAVAAAAVVVASIAVTPFAAASVPRSVPVHATGAVTVVAPAALWPHWGCPLSGGPAANATGAPEALWPHGGAPKCGGEALWPHWGGPNPGWPHWGDPDPGWPHWGGPVS
jgi:hypothetical protein